MCFKKIILIFIACFFLNLNIFDRTFVMASEDSNDTNLSNAMSNTIEYKKSKLKKTAKVFTGTLLTYTTTSLILRTIFRDKKLPKINKLSKKQILALFPTLLISGGICSYLLAKI